MSNPPASWGERVADYLLREAERDDAIADALERLLHERRAARGQDRVVAPAGAGVAMASPGEGR